MADFAKMEEIRARVDSIVTDRGHREGLKPWYGYFCKRPCFHDEYLMGSISASVDGDFDSCRGRLITEPPAGEHCCVPGVMVDS